MPTADIVTIDEMTERVRQAAINDAPSIKVAMDIPTSFGVIEHLCYSVHPVYWEGLARCFMYEGDYFMTKDHGRATAAYTEAIQYMTNFPFRAENVGQQEEFLERALWCQFENAIKLGRHKEALTAARTALDGVDYAIDVTYPGYPGVYWGRSKPIRVRNPLKRIWMRACLLFSLSSPARTPEKHYLTR